MADPIPNQDSATPGTSNVRLKVLGLISSLSLLTYLDRICISRVQQEIERDLGISDVEMGFVFSAFIAGYAIFLIPSGWLADRWGPRRVILRIVLWWSLFTALTGAVFDFWPEAPISLLLPRGWTTVSWGLLAMVLVRFLFGCGEAGVYPTLSTVVRTWFPASERAIAQGTIFMAARIGATLAPFIIGRLADRWGWRLAFVALGGIGVVWTVVFARWFRGRPADHPGVSRRELALIGSPDPPKAQTTTRIPWRVILSSPAVWGLSLAFMNIGLAWSFFPTWQPRYLLDAHQFSFQASEFWTGLPFLCGAAGCLIGGQLSDRILRRTGNLRSARTLVGVFGCTAAAACILAASLAEQAWQAVALFALASFSNDLALAPFWATISDLGGRFTGTLAGWLNMVNCLGAMLFLPFIPWLRHHGVQWQQVLQLMAWVWLIAAIAWLTVDTSRPLVPDDP